MKLISRLRTLLFAAAIAVPLAMLTAPQAHAGIFISVNFAPPVLPVYVQPPLPAPGYIWTPGYWAYGDAGYYWVPGVWVEPPAVGLLWTPGYWGWGNGLYVWHAGYWGPHVGFYGGVNYGFGYGGIGFVGGEWRGGAFAYNSAIANFGSVHVTNVYVNRTIVEQNTIANPGHLSFNGGAGIQARPTSFELQAEREHHIDATANQVQHQNFAAQDRSQLASVNHGHPATMAASNVSAYHQVAEQHARTQPITASDRAAGSHYTPNSRTAAENQRVAANSHATPANHAAVAHNQMRSAAPARNLNTETRPAQNRSTANRQAVSRPAARPTASRSMNRPVSSPASRPAVSRQPVSRPQARAAATRNVRPAQAPRRSASPRSAPRGRGR